MNHMQRLSRLRETGIAMMIEMGKLMKNHGSPC